MIPSRLFPLAVTLITFAIPAVAFAAGNADWIQPATGLVESLESGLVKLGALVVGIGIICVGLYMGLSGEPNWKKIGVIVFGGLCVMAGPAALRALLAVAQ